jgi:prophage regulatory protein
MGAAATPTERKNMASKKSAVAALSHGAGAERTADLIRGWRGVCAETGKSRVQLWRDIRAGLFPQPIELGKNSIAFFRQEVDAWKASRPRRSYGAGIGSKPGERAA